jgi:hypothetical protein
MHKRHRIERRDLTPIIELSETSFLSGNAAKATISSPDTLRRSTLLTR